MKSDANFVLMKKGEELHVGVRMHRANRKRFQGFLEREFLDLPEPSVSVRDAKNPHIILS